MKNESPRLEKAQSPLMRALVRVGRNEAPPPRLLERTFAALGAAAPAATVTAATAAAHAASSALSAGTPGAVGAGLTGSGVAGAAAVPAGVTLLAKWVTVGLLTGAAVSGAAVGTTHWLRQAPAGTAARPARTPPMPSARTYARTSAGVSAAATAPLESMSPSSAVPTVAVFAEPKARIGASELEREVAVIGAVHSALQAADARRALALLDQHERGARAGSLRAEAMYLRMEALMDIEDYAAAQNAARRLLSAYPDGPHAARARTVLGMDHP